MEHFFDLKKVFLTEFKQDFNRLYQQLYGKSPPRAVISKESDSDIISKARGFMTGFDFTMQIQVGCPGGCLFCYVPARKGLTPTAVAQKWGFDVRNKRNVQQKFRKHLETEKLADKTLYWSGVTDPYASKPPVTRSIWQILCDVSPHLRPRRVVVQTRFRPDRDADLISQYCRSSSSADQGPPVVVSYSIGTDKNDLIRAWERATPLFEQRMKAIETLRKADIFVVTTLSPFGPWNNLRGALEQFKSWGVAYVTVLFFKERTPWANTPPLFLDYLRKEFPFLLDPAWQEGQVRQMKAVFGEGRVLIGQAGFSSLASPHRMVEVR